MSDFLSKFNKENYKETLEQKKSKTSDDKIKMEPEIKINEQNTTKQTEHNRVRKEDSVGHRVNQESKDATKELTDNVEDVREHEEETEIDPTYRFKQKKKWLFISIAVLLVLGISMFSFHRLTTIQVPNFVGKEVSDVRDWGVENGVKVDVKQEYNFDTPINSVVKQVDKKGERVKKKEKFVVTASLGPDPAEHIELPDFSALSTVSAEEWVTQNKAENVTITTEFNDKIEKDQFIKEEFKNETITRDNYKREDQLIVKYSKGKEVFEKNISLPNFSGKSKEEVEEWLKKNDVKAKYEEVDSDKVAKGLIIEQNIAPAKKIAKKDSITFKVSKGKALIVPDFSEYNKASASEINDLTLNIKEHFSDTVPFGGLISQSEEAGKKFYDDTKPPMITVVYSSGKPYLKSAMGQLEGDLPQIFFDEYKSKGANITYTTYRMNSDEPKGTVVKMSMYNEYVPLNYSVSIGISNGSGASGAAATSQLNTPDTNKKQEEMSSPVNDVDS